MSYIANTVNLTCFMLASAEKYTSLMSAYGKISTRLFQRIPISLKALTVFSPEVYVYKNKFCYVYIPTGLIHTDELIRRLNIFFNSLDENISRGFALTGCTLGRNGKQVNRIYLNADARQAHASRYETFEDFTAVKLFELPDPDLCVLSLNKGMIAGCQAEFFSTIHKNAESTLSSELVLVEPEVTEKEQHTPQGANGMTDEAPEYNQPENTGVKTWDFIYGNLDNNVEFLMSFRRDKAGNFKPSPNLDGFIPNDENGMKEWIFKDTINRKLHNLNLLAHNTPDGEVYLIPTLNLLTIEINASIDKLATDEKWTEFSCDTLLDRIRNPLIDQLVKRIDDFLNYDEEQ